MNSRYDTEKISQIGLQEFVNVFISLYCTGFDLTYTGNDGKSRELFILYCRFKSFLLLHYGRAKHYTVEGSLNHIR